MKAAILLLIQLLMSVALFVIVPSPFGLIGENPQSWLNLYQQSAELFCIPFCLLIFSFSRKPLHLMLRLSWGLWTSLIGAGLLWQASVHFPEITDLGKILVSFNTVFGFSLVLLSLIQINKEMVGSNSREFNPSESKKKSPEASLDLVEGV